MGFRPWNILEIQQVEAIHLATLRTLEETGVRLKHAEAREMLSEAGARLEGEFVRFPATLVESAVKLCPGKVSLRGRSGQVATLGDGSLHWHNLGGARVVYEPQHGQCRPATIQDVRDCARLLDALPQATTITPFFTPQDTPGGLMSLAMYRHTLPCTVKPVQGPGVQNAIEARFMARMASVLGDPGEMLTLGISPLSPLTFPDDAVEAILQAARSGIPLTPLPCPTAGATAPMSLAGALAQQNAELLACVILAQLTRPGLPMVYCGRLAMMEPRSGASVWGGVELGLASAATVQIGHRYGLPVNVYGLSTNAHELDIQSGFERGINAVLPALAGADELSGIGEMQAGAAGSYAQMVIDDEIIAGIQRLRRGLTVNEDALAVELIAQVMAGARNFLALRHTVQYLRAGEALVTRLAERRVWEEWDRKGRVSMAQRAQAEANRILSEHQVPRAGRVDAGRSQGDGLACGMIFPGQLLPV